MQWQSLLRDNPGNPGGRPKAVAIVRELAQAETQLNIKALIAIRDDAAAPHAARIAAVRELNDRAFGGAHSAICRPRRHRGGEIYYLRPCDRR